MVNLVVQHSMQGLSGLSKDRFVNTFHVSTLGAVDQPLLDFIGTAVRKFFNQQGATSNSGIIDYLSPEVCGDGSTVKIYDAGAALHSPPLYSVAFKMPDPGLVNSLPSEVACCLTLEASNVAGVPRARLRGRIYVGPLNVKALGGGVPGSFGPRPNAGIQTALRNQWLNLSNELTGHTPKVIPQVYSPTIAKINAAGAWHGITKVSTDDAWDIQRRRGLQPTARVAQAVVIP